MLAQLCSLLVTLRSHEADEAAAGAGELRAAYLCDDLVGARLPSTNRLGLAWQALDELLVLHSASAAAATAASRG